MQIRFVNLQIIKRFCHHSTKTNYIIPTDKINNVELHANFISEKITKLEKDIVNIENLMVCNYIFNIIIIPVVLCIRG